MVKGTKQVLDNLDKWAKDRLEGIAAFNVATASRSQSKARTEARWQNITGNARQGLTGQSYIQPPKMFIALFHKVIYGKYLELANDGKFAIIEQTLNGIRNDWFKGIRRLMTRSTRI